MVVIRCTKKLLRRLPGSEWGPLGRSSTVLGDWSGNLLFLGRRRILIFISQHSRLPVLLPARDLKRLSATLPLAVAEVLRGIGVSELHIERELEAMSEVRFAPTNNRSLLGSLNDFKVHLCWWFATESEPSLLELALKLSETLVGPLRYEHPSAVTRRLFDGG